MYRRTDEAWYAYARAAAPTPIYTIYHELSDMPSILDPYWTRPDDNPLGTYTPAGTATGEVTAARN
jgi:hypothetical protein